MNADIIENDSTMLQDFIKFSLYYHTDIVDLDMNSKLSKLDFFSYFFYEFEKYCPAKKKQELDRYKLERVNCSWDEIENVSRISYKKNKNEFQIEIEDSGNGPTVYTIDNKYREQVEIIIHALGIFGECLIDFDYEEWAEKLKEDKADSEEESRDPYGYRGLRQSDF